MSAPVIYAYDDYRRFLADWVTHKKNNGRFSLRGFARRAGFGAHDIMQMIVSGKRNLSSGSIRKFSEALGLSGEQGNFFENLVLMNQADDARTRAHYYARMLAHPKRKKVTPLEAHKLSFFSHWAAPVIYELAAFPGFRADPKWINEQFDPPFELREIKRILGELIALGLLFQDKDGKWLRRDPILDSGDGVRDVHLYAYHETSLMKAADSLQVPASNRHVQVLVTAAAASALPELVRLAQQFEAEVWRCIESSPAEPDEVLQISLQMFPLLQRKKMRTR